MKSRRAIWVLGDQLSLSQAALAAHRPSDARVVMVESSSVLSRRAYHQQKLVLVWSAMRHFADELRQLGWTVDYLEASTFAEVLPGWIADHAITALHLMEPAERPFRQAIERLRLDTQLVWHASTAFLWSRENFAAWARPYKQLRMERFYQEGRRRFGVLMEPDGTPLGGRWNYDQANRKSPPRGLSGPEALWFAPDACTRSVMAKVQRLNEERAHQGLPPLPGQREPFRWGVSRDQALKVLDHFIATRLQGFGPYQDAMVSGEPTLWHALISPYMNLGLLHPLEVIQALEQAGRDGDLPVASLEGVIRQILGWREYMNGLYWWFDDDYSSQNYLDAQHPLPSWFEQLEPSGMACVDAVLNEVAATGYAHHIQRLMVLANYGLLFGIQPQAFTGWFHRMFIDAYDWVMQTNVIGMGLFADGGLLASKPYAASGAYIQRMSNYCRSCSFDPKRRSGEGSCPFTSMYWDFLARHRQLLGRNPRMALMMKQLEKISDEELAAIQATAAQHRAR